MGVGTGLVWFENDPQPQTTNETASQHTSRPALNILTSRASPRVKLDACLRARVGFLREHRFAFEAWKVLQRAVRFTRRAYQARFNLRPFGHDLRGCLARTSLRRWSAGLGNGRSNLECSSFTAIQAAKKISADAVLSNLPEPRRISRASGATAVRFPAADKIVFSSAAISWKEICQCPQT